MKRTFVLSEQTSPDARAITALVKAERELAENAAEFTEGLEQRAGPVLCLHEAHDAMQAAITALSQQRVGEARNFEETALACLIKARKNVRQFLSQSSSCASACRKFDAQQRQKLRTPPKKDDQAKLQQEIEKLAKEEKQIAGQLGAKSGNSTSEGKPSKSTPTPGERQEKAAQKAEELRQTVRRNEKLTDLTRERMDKAVESVRASADSLHDGKESQAGQQAADAAEQLERLAKQIEALTAPELTTKLGHGQSMARKLARQQEALSKELREKGKDGGDQAGRERGLSEEAGTIADLLRKIQPEADAANPQLGRDLRQASEANSPDAAAEQMRRAAQALQAGKSEQAARDVEGSGRSLEALAQQLDAARRAAVQPQLGKLLAAEKQAAETQKALDAVNSERQKAEAEKKVAGLRDTLDALKPADGKLAEATDALDQAVRGGPSMWEKRKPHDPRLGAYVPPRAYEDNVRKAIQTLQAKIQDIILKDVLLDKDEPVPPRFKALVEEYYRILSDDVR